MGWSRLEVVAWNLELKFQPSVRSCHHPEPSDRTQHSHIHPTQVMLRMLSIVVSNAALRSERWGLSECDRGDRRSRADCSVKLDTCPDAIKGRAYWKRSTALTMQASGPALCA
jgi:hypothetical protein